jgi:large subunit ribosomal protein L33
VPALLLKLLNKTLKGNIIVDRVLIALACTECKRRNYTSTKNKRKTPDKIELKKYCKFCNKHLVHKETKIK